MTAGPRVQEPHVTHPFVVAVRTLRTWQAFGGRVGGRVDGWQEGKEEDRRNMFSDPGTSQPIRGQRTRGRITADKDRAGGWTVGGHRADRAPGLNGCGSRRSW